MKSSGKPQSKKSTRVNKVKGRRLEAQSLLLPHSQLEGVMIIIMVEGMQGEGTSLKLRLPVESLDQRASTEI